MKAVLQREITATAEVVEEKHPRVTMTMTPCVQVHIQGEYRGKCTLRMAGTKVTEFLGWSQVQQVYGTSGYSSPGGHLAYYNPDEAERIITWAKENGVEVVEDHPLNKEEAEAMGREAYQSGIKREEAAGEVAPEDVANWLVGWDTAYAFDDAFDNNAAIEHVADNGNDITQEEFSPNV